MPFVNCIYSSHSSPQAAKDNELAKIITEIICKSLGKPVEYICVNVNKSDCLYFGGSKDPSAMIQIQAVGGTLSKVVGPLTEAISALLSIPGERIFINYSAYAGNMWGMSGNTF